MDVPRFDYNQRVTLIFLHFRKYILGINVQNLQVGEVWIFSDWVNKQRDTPSISIL